MTTPKGFMALLDITLLLPAFHFLLKLFPMEAPKPVSYSDFSIRPRACPVSMKRCF